MNIYAARTLGYPDVALVADVTKFIQFWSLNGRKKYKYV